MRAEHATPTVQGQAPVLPAAMERFAPNSNSVMMDTPICAATVIPPAMLKVQALFAAMVLPALSLKHAMMDTPMLAERATLLVQAQVQGPLAAMGNSVLNWKSATTAIPTMMTVAPIHAPTAYAAMVFIISASLP